MSKPANLLVGFDEMCDDCEIGTYETEQYFYDGKKCFSVMCIHEDACKQSYEKGKETGRIEAYNSKKIQAL